MVAISSNTDCPALPSDRSGPPRRPRDTAYDRFRRNTGTRAFRSGASPLPYCHAGLCRLSGHREKPSRHEMVKSIIKTRRSIRRIAIRASSGSLPKSARKGLPNIPPVPGCPIEKYVPEAVSINHVNFSKSQIRAKKALPEDSALLFSNTGNQQDFAYPLRVPFVAFSTAATILLPTASISTSVSVLSFGCSITSMATDLRPSAMCSPA